jgi:hypothetical protein
MNLLKKNPLSSLFNIEKKNSLPSLFNIETKKTPSHPFST